MNYYWNQRPLSRFSTGNGFRFNLQVAQLAVAVEYTNCIPAEE